mgnify:CR=1 FL=1
MATKFEELVNGMVNVGFGAAAVTAEKGKELLDGLNARGEEVLSREEHVYEREVGPITDEEGYAPTEE